MGVPSYNFAIERYILVGLCILLFILLTLTDLPSAKTARFAPTLCFGKNAPYCNHITARRILLRALAAETNRTIFAMLGSFVRVSSHQNFIFWLES